MKHISRESSKDIRPAAHIPGLNSAEIGSLWNNYLDNSMISCVLKGYLTSVDDRDIRKLLEENREIVERQNQMILNILVKEEIPLPLGFFPDSDLNLMAPRLYSDYFYLQYLRCTQEFNIPLTSLDLVTSTRSDVLEYFEFRHLTSCNQYTKIINLHMAKGDYLTPPYVPVQKGPDTVNKQNFLAGFFAEKRPLLAQEISSIYHLLLPNYIARYILIGFRQTARSKKVREYMDRGINLIGTMIATFATILEAENIPAPTVSEFMVTDSNTPLFSDRLMMHHLGIFSNCSLLNVARLMKNSFRHDIKAKIMKVSPAAGDFAEDGIKIRIANGWLEEPPQSVDRRVWENKTRH